MKKTNLLSLAILLLIVFLGCNRKDHLSPDIEIKSDINVAWIKKEFLRNNGNVLLTTKQGSVISYSFTPSWDKTEIQKNVTGQTFFYIPLKADDYAFISGKKHLLKIQDQQSYLIGYAPDSNQKDALVFVKADYQMSNRSTRIDSRNFINFPEQKRAFSGLVTYSDVKGKTTTYQYSTGLFQPKNNSGATHDVTQSSSINTEESQTEEEYPLVTYLDLYKEKVDLMLAGWNIPLTVDDLLVEKGNDEYFLFPQQYLYNLTVLQIAELHYWLTPFGITVSTQGADPVSFGGVRLVCSKICHWWASCGETSSDGMPIVALASTIVADDINTCEPPPGRGLDCNSDGNWKLNWTETGSCGWAEDTGGGVGIPPLPPGIAGGGGGGDTSIPPVRPGDKLCRNSLYFSGGDEDSFWKTNIKGLKFETNSTQVNSIPNTFVSLTNGISDVAMNKVPSHDYFGLGMTSMQYLQEFFPALFSDGDIYSKYEGGAKYWYFNQYAAATITALTLDLVAKEITLIDRFASNPGNVRAWEALWKHANSLIKNFMPGSVINDENDPTAKYSNAVYAPKCN